MLDPIKLVCLTCGKTVDYDRAIDSGIPPNVVRIEQAMCDDDWNGDFDDETWLDAAGNMVSQNLGHKE